MQKAQLRAEREAAERREAQQARRGRRLRLWASAGVLAVAVAVLAAVSLSGSGGAGGGAGGKVVGAKDGAAMLAGIPQDGTVLGDPKAPVTLTEFADLQCPYCKEYALNVLPQIIETYVRPGKVKLDLRLMRFVGPDSARGAQAALAGAAQGRMWQFVDLWYRNQGTENTGYGDADFVEGLGAAAGVKQPLTAAHEAQLRRVEREATAARIESTPSFLLNGKRLTLESLTFDAIRAEIDAALKT
jgi:protein-disulfide isomerase